MKLQTGKLVNNMDYQKFLLEIMADEDYQATTIKELYSVRQTTGLINYLKLINKKFQFGIDPESDDWITKLEKVAVEKFGEEGYLFLLNQFSLLRTYSKWI